MASSRCACVLLLTMWLLFQANIHHAGDIKTLAGTGEKNWSGDGGLAINAAVGEPYGVVIGPDSNLYVCEIASSVIRQIHLQTGKVTTIAGTGKKGYQGDGGPATKALLNEPYEVRFDSQGDLLFVEMKNALVRKVEMKSGLISTYAGTGKIGFSGDDGPATMATFNIPHSITLDNQDQLYICDLGNQRVRTVHPQTRIVNTLVGGGKTPLVNGSQLEGLSLMGPRAMDFDSEGNLILALREGNKIFSLDFRNKSFKHLAGMGGKNQYSGDGQHATTARLAGPKGVAADHEGNIYFADTESHTIRVIRAKSGIIETVAGTGKKGDGPDGDPLKCSLNRPHSVCCDRQGNVYIGDSENYKVRVLKTTP